MVERKGDHPGFDPRRQLVGHARRSALPGSKDFQPIALEAWFPAVVRRPAIANSRQAWVTPIHWAASGCRHAEKSLPLAQDERAENDRDAADPSVVPGERVHHRA